MNRRLVDNLFSGYLYLVLMAAITLFVVPWYVRLLGAEVWGSVAWCLTLQGVLFALDSLVGPLMLRDVAQAEQSGQLPSAHVRYAAIYGRIALAVFVVGQGALWVLPGSTDHAAWHPSADTVLALRLALTQFLFQFANLAAIGWWMGQQQQRRANLRLAGFALAKHAMALLMITQWTASATAYLLPFVLISAAEFALNRRQVGIELRDVTQQTPVPAAATGWRDIGAYALAATLAIATAHIDRVVLSLTLPVEAFGRYFLVSTVLLSLLHLQLPLQRVFLPRMAQSAAPLATAAAMFKNALWLLVLPLGLLAGFAEPALQLWLHDPQIAAASATTLRWLLVAALLHVLASPVSLLLLSARRYRVLAATHAVTLMLQLLAMALLVPRVGMFAGAVAWLLSGAVQLIVAMLLWRSLQTRVDR